MVHSDINREGGLIFPWGGAAGRGCVEVVANIFEQIMQSTHRAVSGYEYTVALNIVKFI